MSKAKPLEGMEARYLSPNAKNNPLPIIKIKSATFDSLGPRVTCEGGNTYGWDEIMLIE